jgi:predicted dehydrogenase
MIGRTNRREFLQHSSSALATATALGMARAAFAKSANDKIVIGMIGTGGRAMGVLNDVQSAPNVEIAYLCDVDESRRNAAAKKLGSASVRIVSDMRKILDDKAIDAVYIATPDHWHSPAAILACEAGKHVYVEKPISHNIREGRLLIDTAERTKSLVQHGTQVRSTSTIMEGVKLLRDGIIGDVLVAKCWNIQRRRGIGHASPTSPPTGLDYENWVGPATMLPYQANRCHNGWHSWAAYGTGDMGNDGVHDLDYTRWGLGVDTHPTRIVGLGGKVVTDDDGDFPDTQQVTFEYPGDGKPGSKRMLIYEQRLWSTNYPYNCDSGAEFYGTKGQMFLSRRGKLEVRGERNAPTPVNVKLEIQNLPSHWANFLAAVRGTARLNADALTGHLSSSLAHLGNIATHLGRSLTFDPQTEQFVDDKEANALVKRQYRDHWGAPKKI